MGAARNNLRCRAAGMGSDLGGIMALRSGFRDQGIGFGDQSLGFEHHDSGISVQGSGFGN